MKLSYATRTGTNPLLGETIGANLERTAGPFGDREALVSRHQRPSSLRTGISIALQYGVPLETLVRKYSYMRFDPEGITGNPEIPFAKSMPDYIMRWLCSRFCDADLQEELGILTPRSGSARWRQRH